MDKALRFYYDKEADILEISLGQPTKAISNEVMDDVFVHYGIEDNQIVGFTIFNFQQCFSQESIPIPIHATFMLSEAEVADTRL